jgi:hypothetical protein
LNPTNDAASIERFWKESQKVIEPRIWDIALFRVLFTMRCDAKYASIHSDVEKEIQTRFSKQYAHFSKISMKG